MIPPDGGVIAWQQVLTIFLININNWGLVNSFGVFQAYYEADLLPHRSPSTTSWIGTLQGAQLLIVGVVAGPLFDKGFFRMTLITASIGLVFAIMMLSICTEYYQVILCQGILLGICWGLLYVPSVALIPVYFKHRRGIALGITTGGGPIGGVLFPAVFSGSIAAVGFGWTVRITGFISLFTLSIAIALSKLIGRRATRQFIDTSALAEPSYIIFMLSAFLLFIGMFVPCFLAPQYSTRILGVSSSFGLSLPSVLNAGQFVGRVFFLWLCDFKLGFAGAELYILLSKTVPGVLAFCWIGVSNVGGMVTLLVVYGIVSGLPLTLLALVLPHICPNMVVYVTRLGMMYACAGLGYLVSISVATALNQRTGGYLGAQIWNGVACIIAATLFFFVSLTVRKRRRLYEMGKHTKHQNKLRKLKKYSETQAFA